MAVSDNPPPSWTAPSLVVLAAIVVVPPFWCVWFWHTGWQSLTAGSLLWLVSVVVKRLLFPGLNALTGRQSSTTRAILQGLLSAASELGAAAIYFAFTASLSLAQIAAFGIGAGCAEAAYVLGLGIFGPKPTPAVLNAWISGAQISLCVRYSVSVERFFALIGHTGSRGLIYVGLNSPFPIAAEWIAFSVLLFALIDGIAVYGHLRGWNWFDPVVCRRSHILFSSASIAEAILFIVAFDAGSSIT